ncbi:MAG: hypothetical protein M3094_03570 [Actinomycetia bacterium]|nr:hypothetical protein [Actinomycetes bacterium]
MRILAMTAGSVALFVLFAVVGWAATDWFGSEGDAFETLETVSLLEYPLNGAQEDLAAQFVALGVEQAQTERAFNGDIPEGSIPPDATGTQGAMGAAYAGGQAARSVDPSLIDVVASPVSDGEETETAPVADDVGEDAPLPPGILDDMPLLFDRLHLDDVQFANPIPPVRIDVCAGVALLPSPPKGCAPGFGGTIVAIDLDPDPDMLGDVLRPTFGSTSACGVSDSETWRLRVRVSQPGTVHLKMWNGDRDSFAPIDAFSRSFEVPTDVAELLPAPEGTTDWDARIKSFCIEVPAMLGTVSAESYIVSAHPPVAGTRSTPWRWTVAAHSGRPPTGLTAFGVDTLFVRTFRSDTETVWVKANRVDPGQSATTVCGTDGATFDARGPLPGGEREADVVGELSNTIPMTIDASWPYEPAYDTLEVRRLQLVPGEFYAVCIYVVGGNRLAPSIVYSEATNVATPSARSMQVTVEAVGGNGEIPSVPLSLLRVIPQVDGCRVEEVAYPGPTTYRQLGSIVCGSQTSGGSISSVLSNGGFAVTTNVTPGERDDLERFNDRAQADGDLHRVWTCSLGERCVIEANSWVAVPRSDILCTGGCSEDVERVVRIPIRGFETMLLFESESGALIRERGFAPIAYADLKVKFFQPSPGGSPAWSLGEPAEYDEAAPGLPETMTVAFGDDATRMVIDTTTGAVSATTRATVFVDRPASIRAWIDPGSQVCVPEGETAQLEQISNALQPEHTVRFTGLCLGQFYSVGIEATDEAGRRISTAAALTTAVDGSITIQADITTGHPPHSLQFGRATKHWQQYRPLNISGVYPAEMPALRFGPGYPITGWVEGQGAWSVRSYVCDGEGAPPSGEWSISGIPVRSLGWDLSTEVWRGEYHANEPGVTCGFDSRSDIYERVETLRIGMTDLTLAELFEGVEISVPASDGGEGATLIIRANFVP